VRQLGTNTNGKNGIAGVIIVNSEAVAQEIATLKSKVDNLEGWQKAQNGSIHEVRADVNKMKYWIMTATVGVALNLLGIAATATFLFMRSN